MNESAIRDFYDLTDIVAFRDKQNLKRVTCFFLNTFK